MKRRRFFKVAAAAAVAPAVADVEIADSSLLERPKETVRGDMIYRELGRTREKVSAIGLGGYHIGDHIFQYASTVSRIDDVLDFRTKIEKRLDAPPTR